MSRRRLGLAVLGVAAGLLAFELALQAVALAVWWFGHRDAGSGDHRGPAVLCVGDSFTYGLGSTGEAGSYPRQLERLLRERGGDVRVVNGAWPGQTSREVLLRLPGQLARHHPQRVLVLVGTNDPWARPRRATDAELAAAAADGQPGFPLRWRTGRMVQLAAAWLAGGAGSAAFVGEWHQDGLAVTFEPGGRLLLGRDELRWRVVDDGLRVAMPDGREQAVAWSLDGEVLHLRGESFESWLHRGPPPPPGAVDEGLALLAAGDAAAARARLQRALAADPEVHDAVRARAGLALAEAAAGGDPDPHLLALAGQRARRDAAEAWVRTLAGLGRFADALAAAEQVVPQHPDSQPLWQVLLAQVAPQPGMAARVHALLDAAIAAAEARQSDALWLAGLHEMRAQSLWAVDAARALRELLCAWRIRGDDGFLARQCELHRAAFGERELDAALAAAGLGGAQTARARALATGAAGGESDVLDTLAHHLRAAVSLCRAAGAEPVLLLYPAPQPALETVVRAVATDTGAPLVAFHPRFTELLQRTPRDDLFVADGHCTDRGYGEMAALLVEQLSW